MPKALFLLETSILHRPFCALQCLASLYESYSTLCILGTFSTRTGHARLHSHSDGEFCKDLKDLV